MLSVWFSLNPSCCAFHYLPSDITWYTGIKHLFRESNYSCSNVHLSNNSLCGLWTDFVHKTTVFVLVVVLFIFNVSNWNIPRDFYHFEFIYSIQSHCYIFRTVNLMAILFSMLHTTPFLCVKLNADVMSSISCGVQNHHIFR